MSNKVHDDDGTFGSKLTEQDILKAFDYETSPDEPMLTAGEITDALAEHFDIAVSSETVRRRLGEMESDGIVASKTFGARAKGWTALVGPRLADEIAAESDRIAEEGEFTPLEDVADDLDVELN
ncbi:helix-turn-helix domain-containing protein [Halomicroarcula sp. S1AR25-4]|uniref:helix-turn-helix domain-containing protein n=1 Tax=Haloarcula sp. S1AR25-4 TaxID=2950538 RepID=UPI0028751C50|nr:helix-turn-helix domain-containing protein [Halomicroarcula sp. S1AR25-4]MDS0280012.1 helix-turn-helix domain-containing protein [Halomicroarcula sp. S1AR25-4]